MKFAAFGIATALQFAATVSGFAADPIRIGDINSYSAIPAFTIPYRNGATLALEEINAAGGVLGRPLELVSRDDNGKPEDALRAANDLVFNQKVVALSGTFFSNVGLAVSDFAKTNKVPFLAAEALSDALTWQQGHRYAFRVRSSTYMQAAMLAEEAAKLPAKRWAVIAPNYEFGHAVVNAFKKLLSEKRSDVEWVSEQFPTQGKIDAGATLQAIGAANPDAIFNAMVLPDLVRLVREGNDRDFFKGKAIVSVMTGQPDFLDPLKDEAPVGWIVTGYPWGEITTPEHTAFLAAYRKRFNDYPRAGSVSGYTTIKALAAAMVRAGKTDSESIVDAMSGLDVESPFGKVTFRSIDHQSTMGMYVGRIALKNGVGTMSDFHYADGAKYLPPDDEVRRLRPQN
ncbi:ABC transporter substrate-binding protein [Bradyrhizobium sp. dw_411]|uniref:ABC transporter substrate-binding protein n=1 Tax=Bradyrhizobium sp. dw_411 TaxID=2720082 RepID=UPI001BD0380C|nr:ABC transporter substrate-binding protein [Bradyrhizobium sp. dw_411]